MKTWRRFINVKSILIVALGVVLYLAFGRFASLPFLFGRALRFKMAVLGFFAAAWGPLAGLVVGAVGEVLLGLAGTGVWFSEVAGAALCGLLLGAMCGGIRPGKRPFRLGSALRYGVFALVASVAKGAACWLLDGLLYRESLSAALLRNSVSAVENALVMAVAGGIALRILSAVRIGARTGLPQPSGREDGDFAG